MVFAHALLLAMGLANVQSLKVAVFSDIHILPKYNPMVNNTCYCSWDCPSKNKFLKVDDDSDEYAPLGRLFCDPP